MAMTHPLEPFILEALAEEGEIDVAKAAASLSVDCSAAAYRTVARDVLGVMTKEGRLVKCGNVWRLADSEKWLRVV
jgi:hypothetical protein